VTWKASHFDWAHYTPAVQRLVLLRKTQSYRLSRCSLCGTRPLAQRRVLVHVRLLQVGADDLDAQERGGLVKALGLCREHSAWDNDQVSDVVWGPGWRDMVG
jgi:hypothetical protein